ncbi:MAG: hypothetical protein EZS28_022880 [Streblomastix strix]|uniref:Uncharacterized protein n=1 Tax=Streblomastix strix TaxID=222440 RepID=A0A5J4VGX5_9EUKA|nr:MAG: hypothetical protein EZS28_022880 [Streblomastix strix]
MRLGCSHCWNLKTLGLFLVNQLKYCNLWTLLFTGPFDTITISQLSKNCKMQEITQETQIKPVLHRNKKDYSASKLLQTHSNKVPRQEPEKMHFAAQAYFLRDVNQPLSIEKVRNDEENLEYPNRRRPMNMQASFQVITQAVKRKREGENAVLTTQQRSGNNQIQNAKGTINITEPTMSAVRRK